MRPDQQIIVRLPLDELWDQNGPITATRVSDLSREPVGATASVLHVGMGGRSIDGLDMNGRHGFRGVGADYLWNRRAVAYRSMAGGAHLAGNHLARHRQFMK